ncbi:hypothetical protein ABPG72_020536 [Tetrahymena utriculariae]
MEEKKNILSQQLIELESNQNIPNLNILTSDDSGVNTNQKKELMKDNNQALIQKLFTANQSDLTIQRCLNGKIQKLSRLFSNAIYQVINEREKQSAIISYEMNFANFPNKKNTSQSQRKQIILSKSRQGLPPEFTDNQKFLKVFSKQQQKQLNQKIMQEELQNSQQLCQKILAQLQKRLEYFQIIQRLPKESQNIFDQLQKILDNLKCQLEKLPDEAPQQLDQKIIQSQNILDKLEQLLEKLKSIQEAQEKKVDDFQERQEEPEQETIPAQLQNIMLQLVQAKNNSQFNQILLNQLRKTLENFQNILEQPDKISELLLSVMKNPGNILQYIKGMLHQLQEKFKQHYDRRLDEILEMIEQLIVTLNQKINTQNQDLAQKIFDQNSQIDTEICQRNQNLCDVQSEGSEKYKDKNDDINLLDKNKNSQKTFFDKQNEENVQKYDFDEQNVILNQIKKEEQYQLGSTTQQQGISREELILNQQIVTQKEGVEKLTKLDQNDNQLSEQYQLGSTNKQQGLSQQEYILNQQIVAQKEEIEKQTKLDQNDNQLSSINQTKQISFNKQSQPIVNQDIVAQYEEDSFQQSKIQSENLIDSFVNPTYEEFLNLYKIIKEYTFQQYEYFDSDQAEEDFSHYLPKRKWSQESIIQNQKFNQQKKFILEELFQQSVYLCEVLVSKENEDLFIGYQDYQQEYQESIYCDYIIQVKYNPTQYELQKDILVIKTLNFSYQHLEIQKKNTHVLIYSYEECIQINQKLKNFIFTLEPILHFNKINNDFEINFEEYKKRQEQQQNHTKISTDFLKYFFEKQEYYLCEFHNEQSHGIMLESANKFQIYQSLQQFILNSIFKITFADNQTSQEQKILKQKDSSKYKSECKKQAVIDQIDIYIYQIEKLENKVEQLSNIEQNISKNENFNMQLNTCQKQTITKQENNIGDINQEQQKQIVQNEFKIQKEQVKDQISNQINKQDKYSQQAQDQPLNTLENQISPQELIEENNTSQKQKVQKQQQNLSNLIDEYNYDEFKYNRQEEKMFDFKKLPQYFYSYFISNLDSKPYSSGLEASEFDVLLCSKQLIGNCILS